MTPDDARAIGAQALFGEKYGDEVRVVSMGRDLGSAKGFDGNAWSLELCGGTHVTRLGEIGLCVILGDSASSAGVRRIEALTGEAALAHLTDQAKRLAEVSAVLKAQPDVLLDRVRALVEDSKRNAQRVDVLEGKLALLGVPLTPFEGDVRYAAAKLNVQPSVLRGMVDELRERLETGFVILATKTDGKVSIAAGVTRDLTDRLSAIELVNVVAKHLGGSGGGGRSDFAQAGAETLDGFEKAIEAVQVIVNNSLFGA
jgi:alanyl-tRNA synthetase